MDKNINESPDRRVLCELSNVKTEPVSPTANLRLLTTLASSLKSAPQPGNHSRIIKKTHSLSKEQDVDPLKLLPRKEKSLGLLCNKFLNLYPLTNAGNVPQEISLDMTAKELGTEKRRIYDIINVLESLEMAFKAGKNRYLWHGQSYLPGTLAKLKSLAVKLGLREQIQKIQQTKRAYTEDVDEASPGFDTLVSHYQNVDNALAENSAKENKSLGVMCQKFIMLFLVSLENGVINLDIAAKVLITDGDQSMEGADISVRSRFKTKVRRLYDIANVLTAIGLIKKVSVSDSSIRKPIFKYTGPDVDYVDLDTETPIRESTRHSLIGMATPRRNFATNIFSQSSSTQLTTARSRLMIGSTTPTAQRREPRKRKLFGTDEKFRRTKSSPLCLDIDRPLDRLDDSILQVAEMELEKLKSSEQPVKSKVCTKLFPRHNSESWVSATQVSGDLKNASDNLRSRECSEIDHSYFNSFNIASQLDTGTGTKPLITVNNVNLVEKSALNAPNNVDILPNFGSPICVNISGLKSRIPTVNLIPIDRNVQIKNTANTKSLKLKVRDPNVIAIQNPVSKKLFIKETTSDNQRTVKIAPQKIQPKTYSRKFVNLANFDATKLIPVKPSDFKFNATPLQPVIVENSSPANTSYALLTQVQTHNLSPGDLFKAVKVGNTLQLVPLCNRNPMKSANEINGKTSTTTNSS